MIECSILHHLWCLNSLRFLIKHRCQPSQMVTFSVWFYKPIISHFSKKMHLLAYPYSSLPVSASFLPRDWMEPMERWRATGNQRSSAANLIQWKQEVTSTFMGYSGIPFPMELWLPALSVQFTWMIRIWTLGLDSPLFDWSPHSDVTSRSATPFTPKKW